MKQQTSIREQLPHGAITRIAKATKTSYATVNRVIDGKSDNETVMLAIVKAIKAANSRKQKIGAIRKQLTEKNI